MSKVDKSAIDRRFEWVRVIHAVEDFKSSNVHKLIDYFDKKYTLTKKEDIIKTCDGPDDNVETH